MRGFVQEFRDFVNRGNFVEIAVAFVMGAAFGQVTTALTQRLVMPALSYLVNVDFESWGTFGRASNGDPPQGSVGAFVGSLINFVVIAFAMFVVVKAYNAFKARHAEPSAERGTSEPEDIALLREIRDALRAPR